VCQLFHTSPIESRRQSYKLSETCFCSVADIECTSDVTMLGNFVINLAPTISKHYPFRLSETNVYKRTSVIFLKYTKP
jgi:hypothetical protein